MARIRSLISVTLVLLLAAAIHVDWHVARPQHTRLSLDWPYHWLLGVVLFAAAAYFVAKKWPVHAWLASALNLTLAVIAGQVLEPLGEVIYYGLPVGRALNGVRWTAFAEFMAAGLMTYVVVMPVVLARRRTGADPPQAPTA